VFPDDVDGKDEPLPTTNPKTMKTLYSHLSAIMILPAALLLSQCAPTGGTPRTTTTVASSQHWVKVSSRPPTFYPRGVAAGCPTDHQSGEWVHTGDAQDTRYFIPFHGLGGQSRQDLVNEMLSMRSERKLNQLAAEDRKSLGRFVILIPINAMGMLGGISFDESDLDRWQSEWHTSKEAPRSPAG
jgi:hypothetical protein